LLILLVTTASHRSTITRKPTANLSSSDPAV